MQPVETLTTLAFYADWRFWAYITVCLILGICFVKFTFYIQNNQTTSLSADDKSLTETPTWRIYSFLFGILFAALLLFASGRLLINYLVLLGVIAAVVALAKKILQRLTGLDTPDAIRRVRVMKSIDLLQTSMWSTIAGIMLILSTPMLVYVFYKVIRLRYSGLAADDAVLYQVIWLFIVPGIYVFIVTSILMSLLSVRATTDPYVRLDAFAFSLISGCYLAATLTLPYAEFDHALIAKLTYLPLNISYLYWGAGLALAVSFVPYLLGVIGYETQRRELMNESAAWLEDFKIAVEGGSKSRFSHVKALDATLAIPRLIGDIVTNDAFIAAYWIDKYNPIAHRISAIEKNTATVRKFKEQEILAPRTKSAAANLSLEQHAQQATSIEYKQNNSQESQNSRAATLAVEFPMPSALFVGVIDDQTLRYRLQDEVIRSLGIVCDESYEQKLKLIKNTKRENFFHADHANLRKWNYRIRLVDAYTELMSVGNDRDRAREIMERLREETDQRQSRFLAAVRPGIALGTIGSGIMALLIEVIKHSAF